MSGFHRIRVKQTTEYIINGVKIYSYSVKQAFDIYNRLIPKKEKEAGEEKKTINKINPLDILLGNNQ